MATKDIAAGEKITMENVWVKRPGTGEIKAKDLSKVLARVAKVDIKKDQQLSWKII